MPQTLNDNINFFVISESHATLGGFSLNNISAILAAQQQQAAQSQQSATAAQQQVSQTRFNPGNRQNCRKKAFVSFC